MVFERSFRLNYLMWAKNNKFIAHKQRDFLFYFRTGQSFDYTLHSGLFCRLWLRLWINRFKMSFSIFFLISIAFNWRCQSLYAMHIYRRSLILTVDCWSCTKFICLEQTATITIWPLRFKMESTEYQLARRLDESEKHICTSTNWFFVCNVNINGRRCQIYALLCR